MFYYPRFKQIGKLGVGGKKRSILGRKISSKYLDCLETIRF